MIIKSCKIYQRQMASSEMIEEGLLRTLLNLLEAKKIIGGRFHTASNHLEQIALALKILQVRKRLGQDVTDEWKLVIQERDHVESSMNEHEKALVPINQQIQEIEDALLILDVGEKSLKENNT